jgi:hypothetical protein
MSRAAIAGESSRAVHQGGRGMSLTRLSSEPHMQK